MAHVALFHHILGVTTGVAEFADRLRTGGHDVTVIDLFDGETFGSIEEGSEYAESVGFRTLLERAADAVADLPSEIVYAGFSLGALAAQHLVQTRTGAQGALLFHHGDVPIDVLGNEWPSGVPVQIHIAEGDPFREAGVPEAFVEAAGGELFLYPGDAHLFTDSSLAEYDADATDLVIERSQVLL